MARKAEEVEEGEVEEEPGAAFTMRQNRKEKNCHSVFLSLSHSVVGRK